MRYILLTACRNEARILDEFLEELNDAVKAAGMTDALLCVVDDLSVDGSRDILRQYAARTGVVPLQLIEAPTNLGNQGAMFYGLGQLECGPDDVLVTLDCDGEDDVQELASIVDLGRKNPDSLVFIERGRRSESLLFKVMFATYKALFRFFTRQHVVPNNFMLVPGTHVAAIRRSPLASVHFAYAVLRLGLPHIVVTRDRRPRYGGRTSQNIFTLVSHGLVGLMLFYETLIAKLFLVLVVFGACAAAVTAGAVAMPVQWLGIQRTLLWLAVAVAVAAAGLFALLLSAFFALVLKMTVYNLTQMAAQRDQRTLPQQAPASRAQGSGDVPTAAEREGTRRSESGTQAGVERPLQL